LNINLPNFITMGRVFSVPFVFWLLLTGQAKGAFLLFVAAGISDAVDGFLAKRFQMQTRLGAYLDPLADKLLIVSIYIALGAREQLPLWLVIAVVSRDLAILAGFLLTWMMDHPAEVKPVLVSKLNTLAQIVLAAVVLADEAFVIGLETPRWALAWITGALTLASLVSYSRTWFAHVTQPAPTSAGSAGADSKVR
jgi:cardiolipin synthase (CMP-forming)